MGNGGQNNINNTNNTKQEEQIEVFSELGMPEENQNIDNFANKTSIVETLKRNIKKLITLVVVVAICVASFYGYNYLYNNPTEIIKDVINRSYEDFSAALKNLGSLRDDDGETFDILNESFKISGSINFRDSSYKDLEKEKINYSFGMDYKNKLAEFGINLTKNSDILADGNIYFKQDRMFLTSSSLLRNKYNLGEYKFDEIFDASRLESMSSSKSVPSVEDIDYILREFKDALVGSLNEEKMTISKETIDIEGSSVKTSKIAYELDQNEVARLNDSIIDYVLANEELLERLASLYNLDEASLKSILENNRFGDDFEAYYNSSEIFALYTTGLDHKLVKAVLSNGEESYEIIFQDDKTQIIVQNESQKAEIQVTKKNERYEVIVYLNNKEVVILNIKEFTSEFVDIDYIYQYGEYDLKGTIRYTKDVVDDNETDYTFDFSISGTIGGVAGSYDFSMVVKFEKGVNIIDRDFYGAIDSKNITDDDMEYLMEKVMLLQDTELYKYFIGIGEVGGTGY